MSQFQKTFKQDILPQLQKDLKIDNILAVPSLEKVVINSGIGKYSKDEKTMDKVIEGLSLIAGQKPIITKAKKAISSFKVRQGMSVGLKITLRKQRMYDFVEKLVKLVLPRMRDFSGISLKSLDKQGNLTIGFKNVSAFPESQTEQKTEHDFGMEVTLVTTTQNKDHALALFEALGFIFKKNAQPGK